MSRKISTLLVSGLFALNAFASADGGSGSPDSPSAFVAWLLSWWPF